jgi:glycosyltransferase involved in cell wall biosynthesis
MEHRRSAMGETGEIMDGLTNSVADPSAGETAWPAPLVSIIIPAYNEARNLGRTLPMLRSEFGHSESVEVIIVDDGSTDHTAELVAAHIRGWDSARLLRMPWNQGKGSAVKAGVGVARGDRLVFMDADLSADIADLPRLVAALDYADVALGSRSIAGSRVEYNAGIRQFQSKFFNSVACVLTKVVASDTQCGFKAFRADAGKLLFHLCEGKGFAFDVEVLALAQLLRMRITEVPIHWVDVSGTSVRPFRDPYVMVRDIMRTRARCRKMERLVGRRIEEAAQPARDIDSRLYELLREQRAAIEGSRPRVEGRLLDLTAGDSERVSPAAVDVDPASPAE